jgi:hypothetical protein
VTGGSQARHLVAVGRQGDQHRAEGLLGSLAQDAVDVVVVCLDAAFARPSP